ncbi:MAG: VCBS repeat-containing protein [Deltaproteobacteria bacterium]|nr:VCBS repeat-containing protein [Deltaproteobacteria bacterium]
MTGFRETAISDLSIEHEVDVNTLTGTARLSVPVRLSLGRESFTPSLNLNYLSGERNSSFGVGWLLTGVASIGLDTSRALPTYEEAKDRYTFSGGQPLVPFRRKQGDQWQVVADDRGDYRVERYRSKVERSFERFEKWIHHASGRIHWLAYARNGVVSVFGLAADNSTRISDPQDPNHRTFQWLLEAQYHPKGNAIVFLYKPEDGVGVDVTQSFETTRRYHGYAQRYLKRILYGNSKPLSLQTPVVAGNEWHFEVVLDYGEHATDALATPSDDSAPGHNWSVRSDSFSTYRPGFEIRTYRLCRRILMFHRFTELGASPLLVGATELNHRQDASGSVLEKITYLGYRQDPSSGITQSRALPPLTLAYSQTNIASSFTTPVLADNLPVGLDGALYQWIDINNEGIPGVLCAQGGTWYFKENLGDGHFGPLTTVSQVPAAVSAAFALQDFDGDGNLNLVAFTGREAGYYEHDRDRSRWEGFCAFHHLPRIDFANSRAQWVDLNGDGYADLIVDQHDQMVWYPSLGRDGFASPLTIAKPDRRSGGAPTFIQDHRLRTFFADMNGDGLLDMVCVDNGRIEYWPNLGNAVFGPSVLMENAPVIDGFGELDTRRLRFVDLDGSGTADLLYIGTGEIRYWINQSGNSFSDVHNIKNLPVIDALASVQVFDFLGDGTRCLVWSTPLATHEGQALQYLRLTDYLPPRLLVATTNSMGRETRLAYRSSAREYLRDKQSERPWHTLLPRHSTVVTKIEGVDHIGGGHMTTRYAYHDGYFDNEERHFVGYGLVDAYDTDALIADASLPVEQVMPPTLIRTWYHTGSMDALHKRAADSYALDPLRQRLPEPVIENVTELNTAEQLDAYRVLAGVEWRQEYYAVDGNGVPAQHPLRVVELAYRIRGLQPIISKHDAVFSFCQSESLCYDYEGESSDPRVKHDLLIAADPYGNVTQRASLAYPRRASGPEVRTEQQLLYAEIVLSAFNSIDNSERFELGIETEEQRLALSGLDPGPTGIFTREDLLPQIENALVRPIEFHEVPASDRPQAQRLKLTRNIFWDDSHLSPLPFGQVGNVTLLHHVARAFLPEGAVAAAYDGRVTEPMLTADGHYLRAEGLWWANETTYHYHDASAFYRIHEERAPNGARQTFTFDQYFLFITAIEDSFTNRIEYTPDYQVLAASRITDTNANISEVLYDPLGVASVIGLRGEQLGSDGNPHPIGSKDLATHVVPAGLTAADVLSDPAAVLQQAQRVFFYDLETFMRGEGPPLTIHLEREQMVHNGEGATPVATGRMRVAIQYSNGFCRSIQSKILAGAGPAVQRSATGEISVDAEGKPILADAAQRWLVSGHEVFNNKGFLVRKYEPFFSTQPQFESDAALRSYGVATQNHYDAAGRVIRQDLPNGTHLSTIYNVWSTQQADANDSIVGSAYEALRLTLPPAHPECAALEKAQAHANTPVVIETDALGRTIRLREIAGGGIERLTTTLYGVSGLVEQVRDPRGLIALTYRYDMLGRSLLEHSNDAGERFILRDTRGLPIHRWDSRNVHTQHIYDTGGRASETRVDGALGLNHIVERLTYGDNPAVSQATLKNARGRVVEYYDEAGVLYIERFHLDGQIAASHRSLRNEYKTTVDWSDPARVAVSGTEHQTKTRFDGLGRVVARTLPDGTTREYDYAALGHVNNIQVTTADDLWHQKVIASGIEANARGQRTYLRYGNDIETRYLYDPETFRLQRLTTNRAIGSPRDYLDIEYTYDPVGNISRWVDHVQDPGATHPLIEGLTVSSACEFTYDPFYQLKSASGRVHQALLQHDYRYGLADTNAIKSTRHLSLNNGAAIERYTRSYEYDLAGNIEQIHHQGVTQNWTTAMWTSTTSNRSLLRHDLYGTELVDPESCFDANGNTIVLPHLRSLHWDHANRLTRAVIIDRSSSGEPDDAEYYVYGVDGHRVRRITERLVAGQIEITETTYFDDCEIRRITHGDNTRLLRHTSHITDGSARLATLHQWSIDQSGRETDNIGNKKLHYLTHNHLGSVSLELDEAGEIISYEEYFPFGGTSFIAGESIREVKLKEYRYSGKLHDDATGFYHYEYRYYAPFIGNWLSPDPLGPADGLNLYRFVHNNPICFIDADGLRTLFGSLEEVPENIRQAFYTNTPEARRIVENYVESLLIPIGDSVYQLDVNIVARTTRSGEFRWWAEEVSRTRVGDLTAIEFDDTEVESIVGDPNADPPPEEEPPEDDTAAGDGHGAGSDSGGEDENGHTAHPADGSSGITTRPGHTAESGGSGSGTTGEGPGAGRHGQGRGGGGTGTGVGQGTQGRCAGAGPGTAPGTGAGSGAGTGATPGAGSSASPGARTGSSTTGPRGDGTGPGGGTRSGTGRNTRRGTEPPASSGSARDGGTDLPPVPPGLPTGPDGIPYSPDTEPGESSASGTPVTDPNEAQHGNGTTDPRGEPASENGSATRPGGRQGGAAEGVTGGVSNQGAADGTPQGNEHGRPGGGRYGLKGGVGEHELPSWLSWLDTAIDVLQIGLDIVGLIPGFGEVADLVNGLISLARGDYVGAGLSFAAMIPFAGWAATAGKWGRRAVRAADAISDVTRAVTRYGDEAVAAAGAVTRHADEAVEAAGAASRSASGAVRRIFADTDVLVNAAEHASTTLGSRASAALRAADEVLITPNQLREFLHFPGITSAQRSARRAFLEREGIRLFGGPRAGATAATSAFQEAFQALRRQQGRGDAALMAFSRATGIPAVTANTKLLRFIDQTLGASSRTRPLADELLRLATNIRP